MRGLVLVIVAIVLTSFVGVLSLVITPIYFIITFKWKTGLNQLDKWLYKLALSIDQTGNVLCATTLQLLLTTKYGFEFGSDEDDTVSYCLGRNQLRGTLTWLGKAIVWILNKLEKDHTGKAIAMKIVKDKEAQVRVIENKYHI